MLKYKYIFQIKYTEAILSNSTRKLLWFEIKITKILTGLKNKFIVSFIIVFGTLVPYSHLRHGFLGAHESRSVHPFTHGSVTHQTDRRTHDAIRHDV